MAGKRYDRHMNPHWTFRALGLVCWMLVPWGAGAQALTLDEAVNEALSRGTEAALWQANLDQTLATAAQARARAGLGLSVTGGYSAGSTLQNTESPAPSTTVPAGVGAPTADGVVPQSATAGVNLTSPLTTVGLKGTQNLQQSSEGWIQATEASATLGQTLWNGYPGGTLQATAEKAALTLRIAELNAEAARNKLAVTVKQAYFNLLSAQESQVQLGLTLAQRRESLKFVQTKFNLGQATGLDLKQATINARTAELDLEAGRATLDAARKRLANLVGRSDEGLTAADAPAPGVPVTTLDEAVTRALAQRIEPRIAQAQARSAQIDAALAWGASTPTVALSGGVTYRANPQVDSGSVVATLGVTVSAPVVDSGLARAQADGADALKRAAQAQYDQVVRAIPVDVAEAWSAWQVSLGRMETAAGALEVAEGQRVVVQTQYEAGLKTIADVQTAEVNLSTAQLNLLKAKIASQVSALTLQTLLGQ